ncbi:glycosyltransferase [bacterium]|nr:glycosyltransferase [bacterium]
MTLNLASNPNRPKVTVGLPVCNGERFLSEAIESVLSQDFEDFELIISDNGSTDSTYDICMEYAGRDKRIKYYQFKKNMGAQSTGGRLIAASSGEYFLWAADDDLREPNMISECLRVIENDDSIVLCYPKIKNIDETGNALPSKNDYVKANHDLPEDRFRSILWNLTVCSMFYGLIRSDALHQVHLTSTRSHGSDHVFLGELSLFGRFVQVPQELFIRRFHNERKYETLEEYNSFRMSYNPENNLEGIFFPFCEFAYETLNVIKFSALEEVAKSRLYCDTLKCFRERWKGQVSYEIHRAIKLVEQGAYRYPWVGESPKETTQMHDQYYCSMVLARMEMAMLIFPKFPGLQRARAKCMAVIGRTEEADLIIQLEKKSDSVPDRYKILMEDAKRLESESQNLEAIKKYHIAAELKNESIEPLYNLGLLYFREHQFDNAVLYFEKAAQLAPGDASIFNNLGVVEFSQNNFEKAREHFLKALDIKPDYLAAINGLKKIEEI